ncbi:MAG: aminoglycoside 6-adenylyltransferase [Chloroflexota bacterium]
MSQFIAKRESTLRKILTAVSQDPRIVGCLDYGSSSEGRDDPYSDLDIALFIQDEQLNSFYAGWQSWAAQFGTLLLAYIGGIGHPWVVYDTGEMPLRIDFNFISASQVNLIKDWPNAPVSAEKMVLVEKEPFQLTPVVQPLINQPLAPINLQHAFEQVCGDFWVYLIRTYVQCVREKHWMARHDFNFIIVGNLLALCRIEAGKVDRWRGANASAYIEQDLSKERLQGLEVAKPGPSLADLQLALRETAVFGRTICQSIAKQHGWVWPDQLAERVISML